MVTTRSRTQHTPSESKRRHALFAPLGSPIPPTAPTPGKPPFRPMASPAGSWHPDLPWWHHAFHDPYERLNILSHGLPALLFLSSAPLVAHGLLPGDRPLVIFLLCSGITHLFSTLAHVWPDHVGLEKLDHVGIISLIIGTPITALMSLHPPVDVTGVLFIASGLLIAAFMPKIIRVVAFAIGSLSLALLYFKYIINLNLIIQLALYLAGALAFVRNEGEHVGHVGFHDHHFLHYFVSAGTVLHIKYLFDRAMEG